MTTPQELRTQADRLRLEAARLYDRAVALEAQPIDRYQEGTVLIFTREGRYGNGSRSDYRGPLKYAAVKAGQRDGCWFLTGLTQEAKTWEQLLAFIGEKNFPTVRTVGWGHLVHNAQEYASPDFRSFH